MKDSNKYPVSRKDNIVVQEVDGELLIYDLAIDKAFCLNSTSRLVWQASDGNKSTAEIADFVSKKLNLPASEDLIWFALEQLKKENLIENGSLETSPFKGMKRREVIRKVGLSTYCPAFNYVADNTDSSSKCFFNLFGYCLQLHYYVQFSDDDL